MKLPVLLCLVALAPALAGCGLKGPLYLPDDKAPAAAKSASPADKATDDSETK